jgi:hypothetical protein
MNTYKIGTGYNINVRMDSTDAFAVTISVPDEKYGQLHGVVLFSFEKLRLDPSPAGLVRASQAFLDELKGLFSSFEHRRLNIPTIGCRARPKGDNGEGSRVTMIDRRAAAKSHDAGAWAITLENSGVEWSWSQLEYAP